MAGLKRFEERKDEPQVVWEIGAARNTEDHDRQQHDGGHNGHYESATEVRTKPSTISDDCSLWSARNRRYIHS